MNKKQLIKILKKRFRGEKISLRQLSQEINLGFDELYSATLELESEQIVTLKKIQEIGRRSHIDVEIDTFTPPKEKDILRHPLFIAICAPLVVGLIFWISSQWIVPIIQKNQIYSYKRNIAFSIYPEVLGNVNKIKVCITKLDAKEKLETDNIKFSTELFKKYYKEGLFGGGELDKQLANFYNNINSIDILFNKIDYERIRDQGESVLQLLSNNYYCIDYDKVYLFRSGAGMMATSQATLVNTPIAASSDTVIFKATPIATSGVAVHVNQDTDNKNN